jgi:cell division septum initiation protein DivIVA
VAKREQQVLETQSGVTPGELRAANLPLQAIGGYARAETDRLLQRAAEGLEERSSRIADLRAALDAAHLRLADRASREPASVEHTVGEVLVTAHRAAEVIRDEADEEAAKVLADAREQAQKLVAEADGQLREIEAARLRAEAGLAETQEETGRVREDAERSVAELRAEARRVHTVIEEFRNEWWNSISETLKQLELGVSSVGATSEQEDVLDADLRRRLGETQDKEGTDAELSPPEIESHQELGSS